MVNKKTYWNSVADGRGEIAEVVQVRGVGPKQSDYQRRVYNRGLDWGIPRRIKLWLVEK